MNQSKTHIKKPLNKSKEKALITLAQRGDFGAFEAIYNQYFHQVYNRVWYLVPRQDVEDVTQETFTAAVKSLKSFRGDSKFSTWLRTLTNRQIANYYRRRNRSDAEVELDLEDLEFKNPSNVQNKARATDIDDMIFLQQGLGDLPKHYREILLLRFADGMKFKEIAKFQGKTIEAVKSLFRRAIAALRDELGEIHG